MSNLTGQNRMVEAVGLAGDLLARLSVPPPEDPARLEAEITAGLDALYQWFGVGSEAEDLARPEYEDPRIRAIAATIDRALPPAFFTGHPLFSWMIVQAGRLWAEHGPAATLLGPLGHASFMTVALRDDYHTGVAITRRVLAVGEARGYEPDTSRARFTYSAASSPWFEPIETTVLHSRRAHDGLVSHGELYFAGGTFYSSVPELFDCAATLDELLEETDRAITFCARTGNEQAGEAYVAFRQLARALRGETANTGAFTDPDFDETEYLAKTEQNMVAAAYHRVSEGAVRRGIRGRGCPGRARPGHRPPGAGHPGHLHDDPHAHAAGSRGGHRARTAEDDDRDVILDELDVHRDWLAARAEQVPENFRHLMHLANAERAWATGDFRGAAWAFDAAHREVVARRRPWHRALILERAAQCYLANGIEQNGYRLLGDARQAYAEWGATAKVVDLDRSHPALAIGAAMARLPLDEPTGRSTDGLRSTTFGTSEIDLIAIIKAAQELGSETDLDGLQSSVTTILSALSGATTIRMALKSDEAKEWFLSSPTPGERTALSIDDAVELALVPMSAFRYAERTLETLVVEDATRDDRFARDPYFEGVGCCSLLVMPVLTRGEPKAILVLENRAQPGCVLAGPPRRDQADRRPARGLPGQRNAHRLARAQGG